MEQTSHMPTPAAGLAEPQLDVLVRQVDVLPSPPSLATTALRAVLDAGDPAVVMASQRAGWELLCLSDTALGASVLRLVRQSQPLCESVTEAIAGLDASTLSALLLSVDGGLDAEAPDGAVQERINHPALWAHSLTVALLSERLAQFHGRFAPALAYTCGLLHDVGKLGLVGQLPKSVARCWAAAATSRGSITEAERGLLGVDHCGFGRRLAIHWKLPSAVRDCAWLHHQPYEALPSGPTRPELIGLVALANTLALSVDGGLADHGYPRGPEFLARQLGLDPAVLVPSLEDVQAQVAERRERLGVGEVVSNAEHCRLETRARGALAARYQQLLVRSRHGDDAHSEQSRLLHLTDGLTAHSPVTDVLASVARAFDGSGKRSGGVVAYAIDAESAEILAVCPQATNGSPWRRVGCIPGVAAPRKDGPAGKVLAALLQDPSALGDWVDAAEMRHVPLLSAGQWAGGVFVPGDPDAEGPAVGGPALREAAGLVLSLAADRGRVLRLSEQLAGASQVLAETQNTLAEQKTLSAVGEMAAGAAHELNNPLAVVSGRAQLMRERAETEEQRRTWNLIAEQAQRISDIISELMEFASPPMPAPMALDVRNILNQAAESFVSSDHPQAAAISFDMYVGERVPLLWADPRQVQAVLAELITNAANASPAATKIRLAAETDTFGRHVLLTIQDDGPGMDDQTLASAYTPFFSVQRAGRRRGLGLPKAKRYVEINGGRIWMNSRPGAGTTVSIQWPSAPAGR